MPWEVSSARITGDLEFEVCFADGTAGRVKILPSHLSGVFARLADPTFFRQMSVTNGFVSWPQDIDLAPDAMYSAIKEHGTWVLS